jgi:hypothetical protein
MQKMKYSAKSENNTKNPNITSDKIIYLACDLHMDMTA